MSKLFSDVKFNKFPAKDKVLGKGSFIVGGAVTVYFTYIQGTNGPFVALPQEKRKGQDGKDSYFSLVYIPKEHTPELNQLVAAAYKGTPQEKSNAYEDDDLPF